MGLATTGGAEVEGESQVKKSRRAIGTGGRLAGLRLRLRLRLAGWLLYSILDPRTSSHNLLPKQHQHIDLNEQLPAKCTCPGHALSHEPRSGHNQRPRHYSDTHLFPAADSCRVHHAPQCK